jgi:prepilin-type N-terminal cleavage/methylation domain-containing protein
MHKRSVLRNQRGFTLIEIIAVLVILGILAAVAVPKYLNMTEEARIKSAQLAVAEIKGRLNSAQAKYMVTNSGDAPTSTELFTYATGADGYESADKLADVGADYVATVETGKPIKISVKTVQTVDLKVPVEAEFKGAGD